MPIEVSVGFFVLMNLVAAVLYLLMAFLPNAAITRRMMGSLWSIALPAIIHTAYIVLWIAFQPRASGSAAGPVCQIRGLRAGRG
jgi:hypothetical protein